MTLEIEWLDRSTDTLPYFTLAGTDELYREACAHLGIAYPEAYIPEKANACVHYYENQKGESSIIVCFDIVKWLDRDQVQTLALLVHEASHVVNEHFEQLGEKNPASEQRAYALQYVFAELFHEYRRQKEALTKRA